MTADLIVGLSAGTTNDEDPQLPLSIELDQNYPNPFNPSTLISFTLSADSHCRLDIFNILGETVRTLVNDHMEQGTNTIVWDGRDDLGRPAASGVYLYRLVAGDIVEGKKMVLLR